MTKRKPRTLTATHARCCRCRRMKPHSQFNAGSGGKKFHSYCKPCALKVARSPSYKKKRHQWVRRNVGLLKKNKERYRSSGKTAFWNMRHLALKRGIPFEITFDDFASLRSQISCSCCGNKVEWGHRAKPAFKATIDRFIPKLGYVVGNVSVLCARCNVIKNDGTIEDVERVLLWMKQRSC